MKEDNSSEKLRKWAERLLKKTALGLNAENEAEIRELIHDLNARRIELEMQNEELRSAQAQLGESQRKYRALFENASDAIYLINSGAQKIIDCNPKASEMTGYTVKELKTMSITDLHPQEEESIVSKIFRKVTEKGSLSNIAGINQMRRNGAVLPVEINAATVRLGEKTYTLSIVRDVTHRKKTEDTLKESEEKAKAICGTSIDAIIMMDGEGVISYFNRAAERIFGYRQKEIIGKMLHHLLVSEKAKKEYYQSLPGFKETGQCRMIGKTVELHANKKDGTRFPIEISISSFKLQGVWQSVGVVRDITARKKIEKQLEEAAVTDELTGLFNRRGFFTLFEKHYKSAKRHKRRFTVLYADLDNFKALNDKFGHKAGDRALADTAAILRESFRESDIIGRIGGDEFAALITDTSGTDVESTVMMHIRNNLKLHNEQEKSGHELMLSMGMSHYDPEVPRTLNELITQADASMYEDKQRRKRERETVPSLPPVRIERRAHTRYEPVGVCTAEINDMEEGNILNISLNGIHLKTSDSLKVQRVCKINIVSQGNNILIPAGKVVWSRAAGKGRRYESGIQFIHIKNAEIKSLKNFINLIRDV